MSVLLLDHSPAVFCIDKSDSPEEPGEMVEVFFRKD
jgi:hypothetical protein